MDDFRKKQLQLLAAVVLIFFFGTLGYYFIEDGWTILDSFYMVAITITTVGFGEIHSLSPAGRIFTIILVFTGLGMAVTFATQLAKFIIENELKGIFGRKKMQDRIKKVQGHYIVCGHGRTGETICLKLHESGIPFIVIDDDPAALESAERRGYMTVKGNAATDTALLAAGVERAGGIVTCIPDDASTMFITLAARELNPRINIISRGNDPSIEGRVIRAGADIVVYPLKLGGEQIARMIAREYGLKDEPEVVMFDAGILGFHLRLFRHFGEKGITIKEAVARSRAIKAVAIKRADGEIIELPQVETEIKPGDSVVMLVRKGRETEEEMIPREKASITWTDEMSTGITEIDEQHRRLVLLANNFEKSLAAGRGREQIAKLFDKLLEYTVEHFRNEERYMEKYGYPKMETQVNEHRFFTRHVMELNKDKRYVFPEDVADFLNSWLRQHFMGIDNDLGEFLKKQGVR